MSFGTVLDNRAVLAITGEDRLGFLQGLVTNDIRKVSPDHAIYALLLSPQGRFLHDLFIVDFGDCFLVDVEAERIDDFVRRLKAYRLRAKVGFDYVSDQFLVMAAFGGDALTRLDLEATRGRARAWAGGFAYVDPRLPGLGARLILARAGASERMGEAGFVPASFADYDRLRLTLGVPDGSRDLPVEKALPIECGLDDLAAIAFDKGCYVGQELTARTHYKMQARKRLLPVTVDGRLPAPGTAIMLGNVEAGRLCSGRDGLALALLRLESLELAGTEGLPLIADGAVVVPRSA